MVTLVSPVGFTQTSVALVGSDSYYVRRQIEATLPAWFPASQSSHQVAPAVVLHHHARKLSLATVQDSFARFLETDDVFQESFTHDAYLLVQTSDSASAVPNTEQKPQLVPNAGTDERIPPDLADYLKAKSLVLCFVEHLSVPEGPYFAVGKEIHQAWRLFPDQLGAFATSVVPNDTTPVTEKGSWRFVSLQSSAFSGTDAAVAIPSRLYFPQNEDKPLNGRRISVKDNMHLSGVVTGLGNRAYAELYGKQANSSKLIDLLITQGAIVVSKTKLSAFAGSEVPPCQMFDTFGLLGRTTASIRDLLIASGVTLRPNNWPTKILYPTEWFPVSNEAQQRMSEALLEALETCLGVKHTKFSIEVEWSRTAPEHLRSKTVLEVEDMAYPLNGYDNYHNFDDFRSQYQERFQKPPYVSPSHTSRWDMDANETADVREKALEYVTVFKKWAFDNIFSVNENKDCSTIILVPHGRPGANYRDVKPEPQHYNVHGKQQTASDYKSDLHRFNARWTTVLTGMFMFEVGDNERNTADPTTESKL